MVKWTTSDISSYLKGLEIKPSYFVKNAKTILQDEDYVDDEKVKKCFFCDSLNVQFGELLKNYEIISKKIVSNFLNNFNYSLEEKEQLKEVIDTTILFDKSKLKHIPIFYCDDCKKILKIGENFNLIALNMDCSLYFELLKEEGTLDDNGLVYYCPRCNHSTFRKENVYSDEISEVEYDIICTKCNYKISHFAYGSYYYE